MIQILLTMLMMLTFQHHINDCGVASVMMVAKYYNIATPAEESGDWHYMVTDDKDRALHISEVVWMLRKLGIETEYTYSHADISKALVDGDFPMIYLIEDRVHFVVLWNGYMLDPKRGAIEISMQDFLDQYNTGVGLLIENLDDLHHDIPYIYRGEIQ